MTAKLSKSAIEESPKSGVAVLDCNASQHGHLPRAPRGRRLDRIVDWERLVFECRFSPEELAKRCGVCLRQLQRHAKLRFKMKLHAFIQSLRLNAALEMLRSGASVKETALNLDFKQASHFSRCFHNQFGYRPSSIPICLPVFSPPPLTASRAFRAGIQSK